MKIKKGQKIGILIIVLVLAAFFAFTEYKKATLDKSSSYSIAMVFSYFRGTSTGPMFEYKYHVGDKQYQGGTTVGDEEFSNYQNRFFKVRYSKENPGWSEILLKQRVTDTLAIKAAGFSLPKAKRNNFQEY